MAEIRPFRALRYDSAKVRLADVITQPYDKITPAMQQRYYAASAANFVRFELATEADPYRSAQQFLAKLRSDGVVRVEDRPAFYVYEQEFAHPTEPGRTCSRRALIGLGRLHDYNDGVVYRHEQTLTGPKKDREQLLKTTRVQSGLLFMLYEDASRTVEQLPAKDAAEFVDDLGVKQRLWCVTDVEEIASVQRLLADKPLFIADGHHRYETALSLRRSKEGKYAEDFAMMALVDMKSDGLVVLPTHRVLFDITGDRLASAMQQLQSTLVTKKVDAAGLQNALRATLQERFVMGVVTTSDSYVIEGDRSSMQREFGGSCELDVEALHAIFERYFGVTPAHVTAQKHVRYHRFAKDAIEDVRSGGAQAAFLIRPVLIEVIRDRSLKGALMPQKSTDFYPKMNSGLTLYSWDESFEAPTLPTAVRVGHPGASI